MMLILQVLLDGVLIFLLLRLWRAQRIVASNRDRAADAELLRNLEQYRAELADLLDALEVTAARERKALVAAIETARSLTVQESEHPDDPAPEQRPPIRERVASLREAVRALAARNLPRKEIAAALGIGIRELDLILRVLPSEPVSPEKDMSEAAGGGLVAAPTAAASSWGR